MNKIESLSYSITPFSKGEWTLKKILNTETYISFRFDGKRYFMNTPELGELNYTFEDPEGEFTDHPDVGKTANGALENWSIYSHYARDPEREKGVNGYKGWCVDNSIIFNGMIKNYIKHNPDKWLIFPIPELHDWRIARSGLPITSGKRVFGTLELEFKGGVKTTFYFHGDSRDKLLFLEKNGNEAVEEWIKNNF